MALEFNSEGLLVNPDPHDWLFTGLDLDAEGAIVLRFISDSERLILRIPKLIGLEVNNFLPGNIVFEFNFFRSGDVGFNASLPNKYSHYMPANIDNSELSMFEVTSSYGCNIIGLCWAGRDELAAQVAKED